MYDLYLVIPISKIILHENDIHNVHVMFINFDIGQRVNVEPQNKGKNRYFDK